MSHGLRSRVVKGHGMRRLAADACSVAGLTAIVKCAGAAKLIVSARRFGTGDTLDTYLLAFLIPSFLTDLLAGSLGSALLPVLVEVNERATDKDVRKAYTDVLYKSTSFMLALAMLVTLVSSPLLRVMASTFPPGKLEATRRLLLIMLPILPLSAIAATWRSLLYSKLRYRIAAIAPVVTPLLTIGLLYTAPALPVTLLAVATTVGYFVELCVLGFTLRFLRVPLFPRWPGRLPTTMLVWKQCGGMLGGTLAISAAALFSQLLAAQSGSGGVSMFNLGTRLVTVVLALGPAALGTVMLPQFSRTGAKEDWSSLRKLVKRYLLVCTGATLPIVAAVFFCSSFLVRVLFQSKELSGGAADQISKIQIFSFLQLPFAVGLTILFRVLASIKSNDVLFTRSVLSLFPTVAITWVLARSYGILGIVTASACSQAFTFSLLA